MGQYLPCFKAYDVRGVVPSELNPEIGYSIGRAYADATGASQVCVGYDIRLSGPELAESLTRGLNDAGVEVVELGLVGTEMVYFATGFYGYDGGIMITASHNPPQYNGMKMVRQGSRPISSDSGLSEIEKFAFEKKWKREGVGQREKKNIYTDYIEYLLKLIPPSRLRPLKVLADAGNGAAGLAVQELQKHLPIQIEPMLFEPDGHFPNGVPNPILPESRERSERKLKEGGFDFGVAWDGDYDRCFFLDEKGNFIEGYYIVGLLAQALLSQDSNHTIIYDPRLTWNTLDIVSRYSGRAVMCKSGHAFIKEKMRAENATYGGEMSAHHYFRDFWYCDSGMLPFLMVAQLVSQSGKTLSALVGEMMQNYPCSGEVNSKVSDVRAVLDRVEKAFSFGKIDRTDGLSIEFDMWRFNLRGSNTEPVIRLNVETKSDRTLLEQKTKDLLNLIRAN